LEFGGIKMNKINKNSLVEKDMDKCMEEFKRSLSEEENSLENQQNNINNVEEKHTDELNLEGNKMNLKEEYNLEGKNTEGENKMSKNNNNRFEENNNNRFKFYERTDFEVTCIKIKTKPTNKYSKIKDLKDKEVLKIELSIKNNLKLTFNPSENYENEREDESGIIISEIEKKEITLEMVPQIFFDIGKIIKKNNKCNIRTSYNHFVWYDEKEKEYKKTFFLKSEDVSQIEIRDLGDEE
jgi:hypothetical protein